MRIITLNCNGIRSAARKGLYDWLPGQAADVVCLQETRIQPDQRQDPVFRPAGYHCHYFDAARKGYSGVAIYSRLEPRRVIEGFGVMEFDAEARYLELQFDGYSVVSLYLPSGSSGPERQASKFRFLDAFLPYLKRLQKRSREYFLCGDLNIAHKAIDLKNWKANQQNSGFLPEERAWLDQVFDRQGWVDAFREVDPRPDQYTWWSNRGQAREKNVGWRIDYQVASPGLAGCAETAAIVREPRFSDHAPLILDYRL